MIATMNCARSSSLVPYPGCSIPPVAMMSPSLLSCSRVSVVPSLLVPQMTRANRPVGAYVEFDSPLAVAFPEVEPVPVDAAAPLLGTPSTHLVENDVGGLGGSPGANLVSVVSVERGEVFAFGTVPERADAVQPFAANFCALVGSPLAAAVESVAVQVAFG